MSRQFIASSSQQLGPATTIASGLRDEPLTIGSTVALNSNGNGTVAAVYDPTTPFRWFALHHFYTLGSYTFRAETRQSFSTGSSAIKNIGGGPLPNTWYRVIARFAAADNRSIHVSGQGSTTNTTSRSLSACSNLTIGSCGGQYYYNSSIGPTAFWAGALSDDEVAAWLAGEPAEGICPSNLKYNYPLWGEHSPEAETISGKCLTVVNNPAKGSTHPFTSTIWGPRRVNPTTIITPTRIARPPANRAILAPRRIRVSSSGIGD